LKNQVSRYNKKNKLLKTMTNLTKSQSDIYKNNQTEIENELLRQIMYMKHQENEAINYNEH